MAWNIKARKCFAWTVTDSFSNKKVRCSFYENMIFRTQALYSNKTKGELKFNCCSKNPASWLRTQVFTYIC